MNSEIRPDTLISRSEDMIASEIDGQYLLMSIEHGNYVTLREVSARIWELLENPVTVERLVEAMQQEYEIDSEACKATVAAYVKEMVERRLLTLGLSA